MEQKDNFKILCAPIQGLTELPWRHYHHEIYGDGVTAYYTPFLRVERGEVRYRDVRDLKSPLNASVPLVPQIILRDVNEFTMLCNAVTDAGYNAVDINMGCPFPPQVHHGRGSGMIGNVSLLRELSTLIQEKYASVSFSIKMRLGVERPDEWRDSIDTINALPLTHLAVHPRTARQQYEGELYADEFKALLEASAHPVVFNGDIVEPTSIDKLRELYPTLGGAMIGRGMFMRPSIVAEWRAGQEWDTTSQSREMLKLHENVYNYYRERLSGDAQILGKVKPFWDYFNGVDRRTMKMIKKATSLRKYDDAIAAIERDMME